MKIQDLFDSSDLCPKDLFFFLHLHELFTLVRGGVVASGEAVWITRLHIWQENNWMRNVTLQREKQKLNYLF